MIGALIQVYLYAKFSWYPFLNRMVSPLAYFGVVMIIALCVYTAVVRVSRPSIPLSGRSSGTLRGSRVSKGTVNFLSPRQPAPGLGWETLTKTSCPIIAVLFSTKSALGRAQVGPWVGWIVVTDAVSLPSTRFRIGTYRCCTVQQQ